MLKKSETQPVSALCKILNLKNSEQAFEYFDNMEEAYRILYKEHALVKNKLKFVSKVKKSLPFWVKIFTSDINRYLGIDNVIEIIPKPTIQFRYCNPTGCNQLNKIVMDVKTISKIKQNLQNDIKTPC